MHISDPSGSMLSKYLIKEALKSENSKIRVLDPPQTPYGPPTTFLPQFVSALHLLSTTHHRRPLGTLVLLEYCRIYPIHVLNISDPDIGNIENSSIYVIIIEMIKSQYEVWLHLLVCGEHRYGASYRFMGHPDKDFDMI